MTVEILAVFWVRFIKTYMLADVAEEMKGLSMRTFDDYGVHWRNFCHR